MLSIRGLRVFADARFRTVVAGLLFGLVVVFAIAFLTTRAAMPLTEGQFGIDFADYYAAADRLKETGTPYAPEMLSGPVPAQGLDRYRYPPPLAQVLVPATAAGLATATVTWLGVQLACIVVGVLAAARAAGIRPGLESVLWLGAATAWFLPVLDTLWKGNVSGIQVLLVALLFSRAAAGGIGTAANATLKLVPILLAPIVLVRSRRSALAFVIGLVVIVVPSLILAPVAWGDYLLVLGNLIGGSADYVANLAPDAVARTTFGVDGAVAQAVRGLTVALGVAMLVAGVVLARRAGGWPAAAVLGTAAVLLIPAALWYHYLAVLLSLAIIAWPVASSRGRVAIVCGGLGVTIGIAWLPLALAGAGVIVVSSLWAVLPRPRTAW